MGSRCGVVRDLAILRDRSSGKSRGCAFVSYLALSEAEEAIKRFDRQLLLPGAQSPLEEDDILQIFEAHGEVESLSVFKCRRTGRSKGCGFVSMQSREAAISAMENLDERHTFDASGTALSVRWADPELQQRKKKAMDEANSDNRMLFFAKVLRSTTEDDVRRLFTRFGKVHDVNLFRAFQGAPTTKAVAAIAALDGKFVWEGMDCPMVVKWMDTALQRRRREQHLASIRAPQQLPSASIGGLLGGGGAAAAGAGGRGAADPLQQYGERLEQYGAPMGGPSVVPLGGSGAATAGMSVPGPPGLTIVQHPPPGAAGLGGGSSGLGGGSGFAMGMGMGAPGGAAGSAMYAPAAMPGGGGALSMSGMGLGGLDPLAEPMELPPPGCNPDAIKLFVGNIPKSCTEDQLLPLFQSIGKVVELVIVYDKVTHESKGSAFVWYASRADAERAILQFNLRHCFPDPSGAQDRPLVVRRAKARARGLGSHPAYATVIGQAGMGGLAGPYYQRTGGAGMGGLAAMPGGAGGLSIAALASGMDGLQLVDHSGGAAGMGGMAGVGMQGAQLGGGYMQPVAMLGGGGAAVAGGRQGLSGGTVITLAGQPGGQQAGLYETYGTGDQLLTAAGYGGAGPSGSGGSTGYTVMLPAAGGQWDGSMGGAGSGGGNVVISIALNGNQLSAVNQHLFSVQTVSGAGLQLSPGAPGLFNLLVSGSKAQVESAKNLIATVLGGGM
ncbi:hypothetical protein GPECTOR_86g394 [Gonium pectorale]|uniref:RRM domain-containing protein n=1 Tax=Gonium pectorale TaxID=33097 RepID=A0A150G2R1_GONPE|nr:hypothetical protein GPECTOR_86g394 [Gonium pectorale]|eukprot:KXZ43600.1 hypothetical protein GPECTOR_86g394 [Gonium pectorale]